MKKHIFSQFRNEYTPQIVKYKKTDTISEHLTLYKNGKEIGKVLRSYDENIHSYVQYYKRYSENYVEKHNLGKCLCDKKKELTQSTFEVYEKYDIENPFTGEEGFLDYYLAARFSEESKIEHKEHYTYTQIYEDILNGKFHLIENREELDDYYSSNLRIEEWDNRKIYRCFHEKGFDDFEISLIQEVVHGDINIFNYIKLILDECNDKKEFLFVIRNISIG